MMSLYTFRSASNHPSIASRYASVSRVLIAVTNEEALENVEQKLAREGLIELGWVDVVLDGA